MWNLLSVSLLKILNDKDKVAKILLLTPFLCSAFLTKRRILKEVFQVKATLIQDSFGLFNRNGRCQILYDGLAEKNIVIIALQD